MDTWDCHKCGVENEYTEGFGDDETCNNCGTVHECDFECDYDNVYHWVIGIKEKNKSE